MKSLNLNPVYVYTAIADAVALLIGFGVVAFTDAQIELVMGLVASLILVFTGVSIPAARNVSNVAQDSYDLGVRDARRGD